MLENTQEALSEPLGPTLEILRRHGDFRVWSVIVTLFGDLAQDRADRISGALLSRLCARMGIRPEAMRVALHRLRKDGWIISERTGRTSTYSLSDKGFAQSLAARGRIYAPAIEMPENWTLCLAPPMASVKRLKCDQDMAAFGALVVASGVYLSQAIPQKAGLFCVSGELSQLPDWLTDVCAPQELTNAYRALSSMLHQLGDALEIAPPADDLDIVVLRVLIIHNWRRLVLRHAPLPAEFYPDDWAGLACRRQVNTLLSQLKRRNLEHLLF